MLPTHEGKVPSLVFHGIDGVNQRGDDFPSWYNPDEASQVFFYVNELYRLGVSKKDIGIITPYIKQVNLIYKCILCVEFLIYHIYMNRFAKYEIFSERLALMCQKWAQWKNSKAWSLR